MWQRNNLRVSVVKKFLGPRTGVGMTGGNFCINFVSVLPPLFCKDKVHYHE